MATKTKTTLTGAVIIIAGFLTIVTLCTFFMKTFIK
jgi:hypothetical protein